MAHRIVISDTKTTDYDAERDELARVDATVESITARTPEQLVEGAGGADGLIVDAGTPVTRAALADLDVEVVGRAGIGVDNVDLDAAEEFGVTVVHVPDYCVDEVSTQAITLLLAVARRLPVYHEDTRTGGWEWAAGRPLHRLRGRTLGLVGFGKTARRLARKVEGFGLDVRAHDPHVPAHEMAHLGVEAAGFEELLGAADAVSVHVPLYDETRGMFDAAAFAAMPEGALFVNTSRGGVVDEAALHDALDRGHLAGAGLDVMAEEPPGDSPLLGMENVVVTPHAAWYSAESREQLSRSVAADVARVLAGERPDNPVRPGAAWG
ncbi:MAG: C-terminal binding protein [Halobacteriaceae archaeon]